LTEETKGSLKQLGEQAKAETEGKVGKEEEQPQRLVQSLQEMVDDGTAGGCHDVVRPNLNEENIPPQQIDGGSAAMIGSLLFSFSYQLTHFLDEVDTFRLYSVNREARRVICRGDSGGVDIALNCCSGWDGADIIALKGSCFTADIVQLAPMTLNDAQLITLAGDGMLQRTISMVLLYCSITDLEPIASLTSLVRISLGPCSTLTDIGPLANCTVLREAEFHSLGISDLTPLKPLRQLTTLNIVKCNGGKQLIAPAQHANEAAAGHGVSSVRYEATPGVSDLSVLSGLSRLTKLDLSGCNYVGTKGQHSR
jgi:hypothetical protein